MAVAVARSSVPTIHAHAVRDAVFKRCCRPSGRYDGVNGDYYIRDR
jgi:hypothetical protein